MEHYIKLQYCKNEEKYKIEYKSIKKQNSRYRIHKTRIKVIHSNNINMDSMVYLLHFIEHDIIKDSRIKNTDTVTVYTRYIKQIKSR